MQGLDPADGKTIWTFPWKTQYNVNATTPIYKDGHLTVWTHAQGVYPLRAVLAQSLGLTLHGMSEGGAVVAHSGGGLGLVFGIVASWLTPEPDAQAKFDDEKLRTYLGIGAE